MHVNDSFLFIDPMKTYNVYKGLEAAKKKGTKFSVFKALVL